MIFKVPSNPCRSMILGKPVAGGVQPFETCRDVGLLAWGSRQVLVLRDEVPALPAPASAPVWGPGAGIPEQSGAGRGGCAGFGTSWGLGKTAHTLQATFYKLWENQTPTRCGFSFQPTWF